MMDFIVKVHRYFYMPTMFISIHLSQWTSLLPPTLPTIRLIRDINECLRRFTMMFPIVITHLIQ